MEKMIPSQIFLLTDEKTLFDYNVSYGPSSLDVEALGDSKQEGYFAGVLRGLNMLIAHVC